MSNSLDSFLTRIGDVTIERVAPRPPSEPQPEPQPESRDEMPNEESFDESSEVSDTETLPEKSEKAEGKLSDDDMDLDETIDSHIGVRLESESQQSEDLEAVNLLENLPLEGAPIEGQEVSEADVLGKISKSEYEQDDEIKDPSSAGEDESETGKRQSEESAESAAKKQKVEEGEESSETGNETKVDKSKANMRRNIREVMDETQLDEATLAAQRQEMERLRRVQDQQKMLREVQRQFMINRQNKGQQRAVSLLQKQNFGGTTISPSVPSAQSLSIMPGVGPSRGSSTVLTKINSGTVSGSVTQINSSAQSHQQHSRPMPESRWARGRPPYPSAQTSISRVPANRAATSSNLLQQRIRMMTPSVSISPVVPKKEPSRRMDLTDSEGSELEDESFRARKLSGPKSPKNKEQLVTISSSSESSDDDCIVLSDPSGADESDNEDDPSNSGMHTNDRYNVPDEQGRVLVNVGHPETEPDVFLAPQVARIIKPHQIGGIRFLYDNIVESIDRYKTSTGFGCILAHSMGLGKTLQVASFCDIFFRCTTAKTVLCIMPINTLQNWLAEFNMWLPYEDPNAQKELKEEPQMKTEKEEPGKEAYQNYQQPTSFGDFTGQNAYPDYRGGNQYENYQDPNLRYPNEMKKAMSQVKTEYEEKDEKAIEKIKTVYSVDAPAEMEIRPRHFHLHILNDSHKTMAARARVIKAWQKEGGVLMIGYELYRQLSLKKPAKSKRKRGQPQKEAVDVEEEDRNKGLLDEMHTALVNPGPDLVICDEGHRIKNSHASISMALKQMRTKRRIVLTGYPLQNNLLEYWCMVDFVRPNYLGTKSEFCNMFERPIQNGQCIDSTPQDIRLMRYRAHVLHDLLEGFVQRRSHSVLQVSLPRKEEYILLVRMSSFQRKLYDTFMNQVVKTRAVPNPLKAFAVCCKIWNHPDILYHFLRKRQTNEEDDLDLEETIGEKPAAGAKKTKARQPKGEGRKGKKGEKMRNKPAASVQPSTTQSPPEPPKEGAAKSANRGKKPFPDSFPVAGQNPGYNQGSNQQYPAGQEYQNYPSEGSQEYNEYYNNNNQMYPQNSSYPQGMYPNQSQNYPAATADQRTPNQQPRYPAPTPTNQNYDGGFPRQEYGSYPDRSGRNFNQTYPHGSNFPNQLQSPVQEYQHATPAHSYPAQQNMNMYDGNSQTVPASQNYLNQGQRNSSNNQQGFQQNQQNHAYQSNQVANYQPNQGAAASGYSQSSQGLGQNQVRYTAESSGQGYRAADGYQNYSGQNDPNVPGHRYPQGSGSQQSNQPIFVTNQQLAGSTSNYNCDQSQQSNLQSFPATDPTQNQPTQFKSQDDQFWQRNQYPQSYNADQKYNEGFYRGESSASYRYQGNYYPQSSQNYQNSAFDYATAAPQQETGEDVKPVLLPSIEEEKLPGKLIEPKMKDDEEKETLEKDKEEGEDEEVLPKEEEKDLKCFIPKEDPGIPYDWATELMKGYVPGLIDASGKMTLFFCILEEAIKLGDRVLAFSQSLFTLNLIEDFLARNDLKYPDEKSEAWVKNINYFRLDGSTTALEREKLINGFNANPKIHLFLVSTRAGSLGINLVGANRAIVFDASWNPCHDTQAVCRVYRYGQQKKCYVYRLVTDNCLERKIYDRQISKQGMADRVVDQCNPDAHLSLKEATTLSWDWEEDSQVQDFSQAKDNYPDPVMHTVLKKHSSLLTKQPFHHESLLVDRKDKKLSQAEKRLARRGYELEKMAANCSRPSYNYVPGNTATRGGLQIRAIRGGGAPVEPGPAPKPVASVRPMQQRGADGLGTRGGNPVAASRWIPAEVWQRQGMSAQEMTLPLDVVIPTNSPDKGSIVLKAGQRVMVLKSPKGIYMQLESGKIIAIRTALKLNQQKRDEESRAELQKKGDEVQPQNTSSDQITQNTSQPKPNLTPSTFSSPGVSSTSSSPRSSKTPDVGFPLRNNSAISIIPKSSSSSSSSGSQRPLSRSGGGPSYRPFEKEQARRQRPVVTAAAKPYSSQVSLTNQVSLSRLPRKNDEPSPSGGDNSNSSDGQVRTDQRVEEVQVEDVVGDVRHSEYEGAPQARRIQEPPVEGGSITASPAQKAKEQREQTFQRQQMEDAPEDGAVEIRSQGAPLPPQRSDEVKSEPAETSAASEKMQDDAAVEGYQADVHMPQSYGYGQYPRYYDYSDPRSRSLSNPYGSYYPGGPPPSTNSTKAPSQDGPKEDAATQAPKPQVYNPEPAPIAAPSKPPEPQPDKVIDGATTAISNTPRDDAVGNVPGYAHPSGGGHYPAYPPGPYDPYAQHYPPPHGSATSAAYPPAGAPGYPGYAGPSYNADYARMYSAFHGPPPADPYMHHRAYAPPAGHPPNYYPPFPHPPPPYPNYSFLPPYPNPNVPAEPQPPSQ